MTLKFRHGQGNPIAIDMAFRNRVKHILEVKNDEIVEENINSYLTK